MYKGWKCTLQFKLNALSEIQILNGSSQSVIALTREEFMQIISTVHSTYYVETLEEYRLP